MQRSGIRDISVIAVLAVAWLGGCSRNAESPKEAAAPAEPTSTAAPIAPRQENVETFQVGELSALALRDGSLEFPNDNQVFGVGRTPEEVAGVLNAASQPTDKLHLSVQPLLVKTPDRVMLFDTGAGSNFGPTVGKLAHSLAEAGVDAAGVTDIFISHVHGDHVGGLVDAQGQLVFPNARIHLSKPEWAFFSGLELEQAQGMGLGNYAALSAAMKPKVQAFAPGAELVPGVVKAVAIKGHTPGHSGYQITSGQASLLFIGDAMHHSIISVQKPEWTNGFDGDGPTAAATRSSLLTQLAGDGQRVYAVHFPFPGLGKLEKRGDGFVWVGE
jgi:glyoxylase-like metal-dependent hydrolase (beta-lactamase superfamily II)